MPKISLLSCWYNWKYCLWKKKCVLDEKAQRMSVKSNENKRQFKTKQPRTKWTILSHFNCQQPRRFIELSYLWFFSKVNEFLVCFELLLKNLWNAFYSLSTKHRRFVEFLDWPSNVTQTRQFHENLSRCHTYIQHIMCEFLFKSVN
jgi:hypothetical protein